MDPRKKQPYHKSTLSDHPEYAQAIGLITVEMVNMETYLGDLLGSLLHISRQMGRIVYLTPKSAFTRLEILENVSTATLAKDTQARKDVDRLLGRAKSVMGKRHCLIHESWGVNEINTNEVMRASLPHSKSKPATPVKLEDLKSLIIDIRNVMHDAVEITDDSYSVWPPYTSKPTNRGRLVADHAK